jgi:site-specific recombinase XerD
MWLWDRIIGKKNGFAVAEDDIRRYLDYLKGEERAAATVEKYGRDVRAFALWLVDPAPCHTEPATCHAELVSASIGRGIRSAEDMKIAAIAYKQSIAARYAASSVNSMLAALNGFFSFMDWGIKMKPLKIQKQTFVREDKELSRGEYERLLASAKRGNSERMCLLMKTICATGIRVSELRQITVGAARKGEAEITNKGKTRIVFLPEKLQCELLNFAEKQRVVGGAIFVSRNGKPLHRTNIWLSMKKLCEPAGVSSTKVSPHNLRHLFARTFYGVDKDIARLADLLGHSSIETTRIYIMESGEEHRKRVNQLGLAT